MTLSAPTVIRLILVLTLWAVPALAQTEHRHGGQEEQGKHRNPTDLKSYLEHLDSAERDKDQQPAQVVEALALKPGMAVADLGSGSGYFTRRFVEAVTVGGKVYAVDVEPEMLDYVKASLDRSHKPYSVEFILAAPDRPQLPRESTDLIFICNVAHHLEDRATYFANVKTSLKAGGRIAIIDFYPDERSGNLGFPKRHLVARDTLVAEMARAGYRLLREHSFLPKQYFLEFVPSDPRS
ncbi:MAG: class I SAM-dependent methyltransferase [Nitrospirae bacterium]|nr:MAG: class I SAM-dependent methyltransferase [Nitrospirota bacterium]